MNAHKILVGTLILTAINTLVCVAEDERWPNIDVRQTTMSAELRLRQNAVAVDIKSRILGLSVDFDPILEVPKCVYSINRFLSEPEPIPDSIRTPPLPHGATPLPPQPISDRSDRHRLLKRFLNENRALFGYDAGILATTRVTRESVTERSGLRTVVWQQEFEGVPIFDGNLIANFTGRDALVSFSSQVVPDLPSAVRANTVLIPAVNALALAARNIGDEQSVAAHFNTTGEPLGFSLKQTFEGEPIVGGAEASLVWLPMNRTTLRMCWRVVLTGRTSGKLFQVLVDVASGEVLVRHCWTKNAVEATYLVFDKDSAAPLLPGWSTPSTTQATVTTQVNLTLTALSANASPAGWVNTNPAIFGLTNTTFGNNVDAHLDWAGVSPAYGSTSTSLPRPLGVLTNGRLEFTGPSFTVDFNQFPTNAPSRDAAVVNAFYWCNWMHDVLYELGFTETAGNFQNDNFGRGGTGGDGMSMGVQLGAALGNRGAGHSHVSPQDGGFGHITIGLWGGTNTTRDGVFDTTIILHEYTHLLVQRVVGGGVGISTIPLEPSALDEGWADFYALALLSEPGDNIDGTYQIGGYASHRFRDIPFDQNYYFGLRAYPHSTDMLKNPMTLRDLEVLLNTDPHPGISLSPLYAPFSPSNFRINEAHTYGLIWSSALWDARANLIRKHGFTDGNWLMLELTTDAMKLGPANPTFLQARDFVLLANLYTNAAQHHLELWTAFAKRGMGLYAHVAEPEISGDPLIVTESFSIPPFVEITNSTHASPAIAPDGTAYIGSSNGWFYAVANDGTNRFMLSDPTNTFPFIGKVKWSFGGLTTNQAFSSSPAISPTGVIYAGCNDSNLYAIASSGTMIWRTNLGGKIISSPALAADGTLYVGSGDGKLYAVSPNGTVKWPAPTNGTGSNIVSSPAIALNGTIYVGSMHPTTNLYAFNPTNGAVLIGWPVTVTNGVHSSPAIGSDGSIYVGGLDGKVYAFTTNGTSKSGWPVTTGGAIWSSPAIGSNGVVYIGSTDSNLYAINPNGTTNWTYKTRGAVKSSPALGRDGTVFVGSDDFNLHVINPDGTARWQYPIGGPVFSSPVIGPDGGLFVGSTTGNLYSLPTGTQFADGPWSMFRQNFRHTANAKTLILRRPEVASSVLNIEIAGPVGAQCDVEVATSLPPTWSFLTNLTLTTGVGTIQTSSTNSQRYYRAMFTD